MAKNTIYLGPIDAGKQRPTIVEGLAVDAFLPGTLLKRTSAGLATTDVAGTTFSSEPLIARELGDAVGQTVTDAYTIGDTAQAVLVESGEFVHARVAAGQNITAKGVGLTSNADGTLKIAVIPTTVGATSEQVLFKSEEIINTGGAVALVKVRRV